jgi:hypothetical protein
MFSPTETFRPIESLIFSFWFALVQFVGVMLWPFAIAARAPSAVHKYNAIVRDSRLQSCTAKRKGRTSGVLSLVVRPADCHHHAHFACPRGQMGRWAENARSRRRVLGEAQQTVSASWNQFSARCGPDSGGFDGGSALVYQRQSVGIPYGVESDMTFRSRFGQRSNLTATNPLGCRGAPAPFS